MMLSMQLYIPSHWYGVDQHEVAIRKKNEEAKHSEQQKRNEQLATEV